MRTNILEGVISILINISKGIETLNDVIGKVTDKLIYISERGGAETGTLK